jgi:hypothetical protein
MPNRCLICEAEISMDEISVHDATVWTSHGNYGSGVYDPMLAHTFLEALICDACLVRKKELIEEVVVRERVEEVQRSIPDFDRP